MGFERLVPWKIYYLHCVQSGGARIESECLLVITLNCIWQCLLEFVGIRGAMLLVSSIVWSCRFPYTYIVKNIIILVAVAWYISLYQLEVLRGIWGFSRKVLTVFLVDVFCIWPISRLVGISRHFIVRSISASLGYFER